MALLKKLFNFPYDKARGAWFRTSVNEAAIKAPFKYNILIKYPGRVILFLPFRPETLFGLKAGKLPSDGKFRIDSSSGFYEEIIINGRLIDVEKGIADFADKEKIDDTKKLKTWKQWEYLLKIFIAFPACSYLVICC